MADAHVKTNQLPMPKQRKYLTHITGSTGQNMPGLYRLSSLKRRIAEHKAGRADHGVVTDIGFTVAGRAVAKKNAASRIATTHRSCARSVYQTMG
jgi:hypothetical protein